jgi:microsomal dipeptidase-like Zn-dependent dipeptidase
MTLSCGFTDAAARIQSAPSSKAAGRASTFKWLTGEVSQEVVRNLRPTSDAGRHRAVAAAAPSQEPVVTPCRSILERSRPDAVLSMVSLPHRGGSRGRVRICREVDDIRKADQGAWPLSYLEGAEAIDANFELLDVLYRADLSLGPLWSRPNAF